MAPQYHSILLGQIGNRNHEFSGDRLTGDTLVWLSDLKLAVDYFNKADYGWAARICREKLVKAEGIPKSIQREALDLLASIKGLPGRLDFAEAHLKLCNELLDRDVPGSLDLERQFRAQQLLDEAKVDTEIRFIRPFASDFFFKLETYPQLPYANEEKECIPLHKKAVNLYSRGKFEDCEELCLDNIEDFYALWEVRAEAFEMLASIGGVAGRLGYARELLDLKREQYELQRIDPVRAAKDIRRCEQFVDWVQDDLAIENE